MIAAQPPMSSRVNHRCSLPAAAAADSAVAKVAFLVSELLPGPRRIQAPNCKYTAMRRTRAATAAAQSIIVIIFLTGGLRGTNFPCSQKNGRQRRTNAKKC